MNYRVNVNLHPQFNAIKKYLNFIYPQAIYISRITEGGAAAKDGKLRVGDRVISVSVILNIIL